MSDSLLHALDLASMREWSESKALLEGMDDSIAGRFFLLVCALEQEEQLRARHSATIRHEIGNALTIARVNMEGIVDGVLLATSARQRGILASLAVASSILDEFGKLPEDNSLGNAARVETFNIHALIGAHAAAIGGLAEAKRVRVEYEAPEEQLSSTSIFRGDVLRIGQILSNILLNAVRYTPPGGLIEINCDKLGPDLRVVVNDSGTGIATEDLPRIFEPGYRGRNARGTGSGIGLSVVDKMLKSIGGNARIEKSPGGGVAFIITLPVSSRASFEHPEHTAVRTPVHSD